MVTREALVAVAQEVRVQDEVECIVSSLVVGYYTCPGLLASFKQHIGACACSMSQPEAVFHTSFFHGNGSRCGSVDLSAIRYASLGLKAGCAHWIMIICHLQYTYHLACS